MQAMRREGGLDMNDNAQRSWAESCGAKANILEPTKRARKGLDLTNQVRNKKVIGLALAMLA